MWSAIQTWMLDSVGAVSFGNQSFFQQVITLIAKNGPMYLDGVGKTMLLAIVGTIVGLVIGLGVGIIQTIPLSQRDSWLKKLGVKSLKAVMAGYVELFRGTPMMIQAVFIFFGLPYVFNFHMPILTAALFIISINTGAYMAETVRGGILSIDPGQTEGAKAIGMTHVQTMLHIILPQTMRNIMPQIGNNLIINIKDSCVLSVITVVEIFFVHKGVAGATYAYFPSATITMVIYLILTVTCSRILRILEKKMDGSDSYDLATADTLAHTTGLYSYPKRGSNFDERSVEYQDDGNQKGGE